MPYGWKIEFNSVDISSKISGFTMIASLESYCREMTLDIADPSFYAGLDFSQVPETPEIEIFTKIAAAWVSQGTFFIERPALTTTTRSDLLQGVWGRSMTARLAEPFAPKVNKLWDVKTTFFAMCQEMCELAGLVWDDAYSDIDDFIIRPHTYAADSLYPIDVITELAGLAGALVTTDRAGHVCIKRIDYAPSSEDETLTDAAIREITENPEWPAFANRVRITPTGALAGYSVEMTIADTCLPADGATRTKLFAEVKDPQGNPVDGLLVTWTVNASGASLNNAASNTREIRITREKQRAASFYTVRVDFPPSDVDGVWAYSDRARKKNLANDGYTLSGNTITLNAKLAFCDQTLVIAYRSQGIAINYLQAGTVTEDVTVTADIEGEAATEMVYIDNPCQCPAYLSLVALPFDIHIGEDANLLVYMEESGPMTSGRTVYMSEGSAQKRGSLSWTAARFGKVAIANEKSTAVNEISGVTQCELNMFPASVTSVYKTDVNGNPTGGNLYASHSGKLVDLNTTLSSGTDLIVNYKAQGAALNHFTGEALGTARINAFIRTTREALTEAEVLISVIDEESSLGDYPEGWTSLVGTPADAGGDEGEFNEEAETEPPSEYCISENVSSDPTEVALDARFAGSLENECDCDDTCAAELDIFDTTQAYDNASYRPISQIVTEDYGHDEGTPEYWEQYETSKQAALADCLDRCEGCEGVTLEWSAGNPETIDVEAYVAVTVTGGKPPFYWSVLGTGFSLASAETTGRLNTLSSNDTAGGTAEITVLDSCGLDVTGHVRCVNGEWCLLEVCSKHSLAYHPWEKVFWETQGKYRYFAAFCVGSCVYTCDNHCDDGSCDTPISPPSGSCCTFISHKYEWKSPPC